MTGPSKILVDITSAMHGRPRENQPYNAHAINKTHSDMLKFSRDDSAFEIVLKELTRLASDAVQAIPRGMSHAEGT